DRARPSSPVVRPGSSGTPGPDAHPTRRGSTAARTSADRTSGGRRGSIRRGPARSPVDGIGSRHGRDHQVRRRGRHRSHRARAAGAGFQLSLACDLRVVAPNASFAMLQVGYGLVPDLGGAHRLARAVGTARAKDLVWTGRSVDAGEALAIGLANRLAPDDDVAG